MASRRANTAARGGARDQGWRKVQRTAESHQCKLFLRLDQAAPTKEGATSDSSNYSEGNTRVHGVQGMETRSRHSGDRGLAACRNQQLAVALSIPMVTC